MSRQVVTSPSIDQRGSRTWFVATVTLVVGLGVGAAVVAVTSTDSATSSRTPSQAITAPVSASSATCAGDAGYLLAAVVAMPTADASRLVSGLSPQTRAMLRSGALASAASSTRPANADPATLAGVLSRIGTSDASAIMSGLAPETRAAVGLVPATPQACN
jgi:hypothetical protein